MLKRMVDSWDRKKFEELASLHLAGKTLPGMTLTHLQAFFAEAFAHYEEATTEGKNFVDTAIANTYDFFSRA